MRCHKIHCKILYFPKYLEVKYYEGDIFYVDINFNYLSNQNVI